MSAKLNFDTLNRSLKPVLSSKELSSAQKNPCHKLLQRKRHNLEMCSNNVSRNGSK